MSRFSNLEMGGPDGGKSRVRPELVHKGELEFLAEAEEAFLSGRFEQSLRAFSKIFEFNPRSLPAWIGQVRVLIEMGNFPQATALIEKGLELHPEAPELLSAKAVLLGRAGDHKAALLYSDNAVEAASQLPYVWLSRGDVLLARKEKRADYCIDKALALAPGSWAVHWLASRIRLYYKQFGLGLKHAQQALALETGRAVIWLALGRCQEGLGLIGPAEHSFKQACELDPSCFEAERALGTLRNAGFGKRLKSAWRQLFQT